MKTTFPGTFPGVSVALLCLLAGLPGAGSSRAAAQEVLILSTPVCATCSVRLERVGVYGDADGEGWVDNTSRLALLPDAVVVVNLTARHELVVFDRDGRFLRRMGRSGGGPGEFGVINDIAASTDGRLHVMDRRHGRMTVYRPDLTLEKVIPVPGRPVDVGLLPLDDGSYVVNAMLGSAERIGLPLHRIGPDGALIVSYPAASTHVTPGQEMDLLMRMALGGDRTSFWSVSTNTYQVDRYHIDGSLLESFRLEPPWESDGGGRQGPGPPPSPPGVMTVQERDGLLWILSRRRTPDFRAATSRIHGPEGLATRIDDYNRYYESVLDVVDPRTRQLVSRSVIPGYLLRFVAPGVVVVHEEADLVPRLVLYRVEVDGL